MKIAITGSTGFVGSHLSAALKEDGHQVVPIGRAELKEHHEQIATHLIGCDAVFNLAGESISQRWSEAYKQRIYHSRIDTTHKLVEAMKVMEKRPATFISTSAIGAFSTEGCHTEYDPANASDFLGELSKDWEGEAKEAESLGVRTLIFRFALVLGHDGGLMKQLLPPFRRGLGGPIGNGLQPFSWVHIDDLVRSYQYALLNEQMKGIYHICSPNPDNNAGFTKTLGTVLNRPALLPIPKFALKLVYGEGADVMTSGQCVFSIRLYEAGFEFKYPELDRALTAIIQ
ncbi:MAG: TIGR01777 family oxidoreductase [Candidatus Sedimenticola sp. (ex Thyasira tokunagai)]